MKIYNLTSTFYLHQVIEDGTADMVDTYNTDIVPNPSFDNPRFIEGAWVDVSASDKTTQEATEATRVNLVATGSNYLKDTDWYATRKAETGKEIPADILAKRAQARLDASE